MLRVRSHLIGSEPSVGMEPSVVAALRILEEHLGDVGSWPLWLHDLASKARLKYAERFELIVTLLGNRVPPVLVAEHIRPRLVDGDARRHAFNTFVQIGSGASRLWYWDLEDKMRQPLVYAKSADSLEGLQANEFWSPALACINETTAYGGNVIHMQVSSTQRMQAEEQAEKMRLEAANLQWLADAARAEEQALAWIAARSHSS